MNRRVDPGRLLRALGLTVTETRNGYAVSGGAATHTVRQGAGGWACDCQDARFRARGPCKHRIAVYLHRQLVPPVRAALADAVGATQAGAR